MAQNSTLVVTALVATPTTAGNWSAQYSSLSGAVSGYTTTATAAGTTTLTSASTPLQYFTGVTTQTVVMPVVSTLVLGQQFTIVNNSTGIVTVQSSGANTIQAMASGSTLTLTVILITGTTAASWNAYYSSAVPNASVTGLLSSVVEWDANQNLSADAFIPGFTTTATAAGTTTLTVNSTQLQFFTGATTQTVVLPTTGIVAGQQYMIMNNSTGTVTVNASGGTTLQVMAPSTMATVAALVATPTTAANWNSMYGPQIFATAWQNASGTTVNPMIPGAGYYTTNAAQTTLTLPATAAAGTIIEVIATTSNGWIIAQLAGQSIQFGNKVTTTGITGSLTSSAIGDAITLLCTTANTTWFASKSQGNILVT